MNPTETDKLAALAFDQAKAEANLSAARPGSAFTDHPDHAFVRVQTSAPSAYWENWWVKVSDDQDGTSLLRSGRTGSAANVDTDVLVGRLASGLHTATVVRRPGAYPEENR